jgi:hypothetical protein
VKTPRASPSIDTNTERVALQQRVNEMKRRLFVPIVFAGIAAASGIASANTDAHTLSYFRQYGLLLEVSADPRDGSDYVTTNPTHATRLELVALKAPVRLRGLTVQFADGRQFSQRVDTILPGQRVMVQLPQNRGVIQAVQLDYGRQIVDRTPARLQIIPHADRPAYARPMPRRDYRRYPRYERSTYDQYPSYYQTQPSYTVQPRAGWSGSIEGSFRF